MVEATHHPFSTACHHQSDCSHRSSQLTQLRAGLAAHMLWAVPLQEEQVGGLVEGAAHGVLARLLRALGGGQGGGRAQAGLADRTAQTGWRGAPGAPQGWRWGPFGAAPLQPPGLGVYP